MYRFILECPRCDKVSETTSDVYSPPPHVNCGDCLRNDVEIVKMRVVKTEKA